MSRPARTCLALVLLAPSLASADPADAAAPVALELAATDTPRRLRFALRNVTGAPVEVIADRRLLSFVQAPPAVVPGVRRRRPPRTARCAHDQRPANNEFSPRVTLEPGQRYSEEVDVDDLCGLRVPSLDAQPLEFHYGFAPPRRGAASHARSLVVDDRAETFAELTSTAPPSLVAAPVSSDRAATAGALVTLGARGASSSSGAGLRASVTLRNPGVQPTWTLLRPTQFSFVVTTPSGREVTCDALVRQPAPLRDLFVRLPPRGARSYSLLPAMHCPPSTFRDAGVFHARARFESRADGEAFGMQRVFTGVVESESFPLRVSQGRLVPLNPRVE